MPAAAATVAPAAATAHVLTQVTTAQGETVRFTLLADGSIGVDGIFPAAIEHQTVTANHASFASPLELFRAVAPSVQAPAELITADARYRAALATASALSVGPAFQTAQAPRVQERTAAPQSPSDQWFINDFCRPAANTSFHVCYTNAHSWAYLSAASVYYGHAAAYAKNHPLLFTARPVGRWTVPTGYYRWASEYHYSPYGWNNFSFYAAVNYASSFDFQASVDY